MHWEVLTTVQDNLFEYYIYHWKCKEGADRIGQRRVDEYFVVSSSPSIIYYRTFYSHLKKIQLEGPVQSNESMFGVSIEVVWSIVISRLCRPTHKKRILPSDQGYFQTLFTWMDTTLQNIIPVRVISENSLRHRRWSLLDEYRNIKKEDRLETPISPWSYSKKVKGIIIEYSASVTAPERYMDQSRAWGLSPIELTWWHCDYQGRSTGRHSAH